MKQWKRILCGILLPAAILLSACGQQAEPSSLEESSVESVSSELSESLDPVESSISAESSLSEESPSSGAETENSERPASETAEKPDETSSQTQSPEQPESPLPAEQPAASSSEPAGTEELAPEPSSKPESEPQQDEYLTDPVPEGKPEPVEPQDTEVDKGTEYSCTISIRCDTILDNMEDFNIDKESVLPEDGVILEETTVTFYEGESVFDVLLRETKNAKIHMEYEATPMYNSNYIEGINNLYEFDCGPLSGWMYRVNGWFPNYGCSRYQLEDGDTIEWLYTCDLGRDLGCEWIEGGQQ